MRINKYWIKDIYVYILVKELIELYKPFNQYWTKVGFYLQNYHLQLGPPCHLLLSPLFFSFLPPSPFLSLFLPREKRERESERERESHRPGNHFARNSGNRKRNSNLAPSPVWLVNPLPISLSFRVFVFLGFRWKPVELHQIDCTMSLLFLKCLFVDFVFQFATKTRFSQFPQMWREMGIFLLNWIKPDPNRVCEWVGALMTKLIDNQTELWLFMP